MKYSILLKKIFKTSENNKPKHINEVNVKVLKSNQFQKEVETKKRCNAIHRKRSSKKERRVDALALRAEERRDKLR